MQQAILQALLQMRLWPSPRPTRWTRARKRFTPTSRRARFQISSERPVSAGASRRLRQGTEAHEPAHTRRCDAGVVVQAGQVTSLPCHRPRRHDEVSRCAGGPRCGIVFNAIRCFGPVPSGRVARGTPASMLIADQSQVQIRPNLLIPERVRLERSERRSP
jgi:hypothetical protein